MSDENSFTAVALLKDHPQLVELSDRIKANKKDVLAKLDELDKMRKRIDQVGKETHNELWRDVFAYAKREQLIPDHLSYDDVNMSMQRGAFSYRLEKDPATHAKDCNCPIHTLLKGLGIDP